LMEIVTDPDVRTAEQARRYAEELQLLLRSIGASDADMERGPDACRGERVATPARQRDVRDAGRDQEHELVPLGGAGDRPRDRAPGAPRSTPARRWSRRRAAGTRTVARHTDADQGEPPTTTATSRSPTSRRSTSTRPGSTGSGRPCPSCPRHDASVTSQPWGCRRPTPPSSSATPTRRACSRRPSQPTPASIPSRWRTG
jgi:hypothetical protein